MIYVQKKYCFAMQILRVASAFSFLVQFLADTVSANSCSSKAYTKFSGEVVCPIIQPQLTFDRAVEACNSIGASLPVIRSQCDNDNLYAAMINASANALWLYATDRQIEGHFAWKEDLSDPISRGYSNWIPPIQPDNLNNVEHCVELLIDGKWNDIQCDDSNNWAICEKIIPNPDEELIVPCSTTNALESVSKSTLPIAVETATKESSIALAPTSVEPTTLEPSSIKPITVEPTTVEPVTLEPTTLEPTTLEPTTLEPTTLETTTLEPTTLEPTTLEPTTLETTTLETTTLEPTTLKLTTLEPTTKETLTTTKTTKHDRVKTIDRTFGQRAKQLPSINSYHYKSIPVRLTINQELKFSGQKDSFSIIY